MTWMDVLKILLPAALTVIGALVLTFLADIKRRSKDTEAKCDEQQKALAAFREHVAGRYVTKEELIRCMGGIDGRIDEIGRRISQELKEQRNMLDEVRTSVAALQERAPR